MKLVSVVNAGSSELSSGVICATCWTQPQAGNTRSRSSTSRSLGISSEWISEKRKLRRKPSKRRSVGLEIVILQSFEEFLVTNSPPLHFHFFGILGRLLNKDVETQRLDTYFRAGMTDFWIKFLGTIGSSMTGADLGSATKFLYKLCKSS